MLLFDGVGLHFLGGRAAGDELTHRLVDFQHFMDGNTAAVAGAVAVRTADGFADMSDVAADIVDFRIGKARFLRTERTDLPHQSLGNDADQRTRKKVGLDTHVHKADDRRNRVVRMQSRKN